MERSQESESKPREDFQGTQRRGPFFDPQNPQTLSLPNAAQLNREQDPQDIQDFQAPFVREVEILFV